MATRFRFLTFPAKEVALAKEQFMGAGILCLPGIEPNELAIPDQVFVSKNEAILELLKILDGKVGGIAIAKELPLAEVGEDGLPEMVPVTFNVFDPEERNDFALEDTGVTEAKERVKDICEARELGMNNAGGINMLAEVPRDKMGEVKKVLKEGFVLSNNLYLLHVKATTYKRLRERLSGRGGRKAIEESVARVAAQGRGLLTEDMTEGCGCCISEAPPDSGETPEEERQPGKYCMSTNIDLRHTHTVELDENGNGDTSLDHGHVHVVEDWKILSVDTHDHELYYRLDETRVTESKPQRLDERRIKEEKEERQFLNTQWSNPAEGIFFPAARVTEQIPPGYYSMNSSMQGIYFEAEGSKTAEGLLRFPDAGSDEVIDTIDAFWGLGPKFEEHNQPYKRGIMLYGPPGGGKTCTIRIVVDNLIKRNQGIVVDFPGPSLFVEGHKVLRQIHPEMPLVVLMEDIDAILRRCSESQVLGLLDGMHDLYRVVFLACHDPDTRLLTRDLRWVRAGDISAGDELWSLDENRSKRTTATGRETTRRFRKGKVVSSFAAKKECVRVYLDTGESFVCTTDHPWLSTGSAKQSGKNLEWTKAADLMGRPDLCRPFLPWEEDTSWEAGWLAGMLDGEGFIREGREGRTNGVGAVQAVGPTASRLVEVIKKYAEIACDIVDPGDGHKPQARIRTVDGVQGAASLLGKVRAERLIEKFDIEGGLVQSKHPASVVRIEPIGMQTIQSIETDAHTYFAEGFAVHNSTNYPEKLGSRIMNRPSRFDRKYLIGMPSAESREIFVRHKLKTLEETTEEEIKRWVEDTAGMSIAHINELFVATKILGDPYEKVIEILSAMKVTPASSTFDEYRVMEDQEDYKVVERDEERERWLSAEDLMGTGKVYEALKEDGGKKLFEGCGGMHHPGKERHDLFLLLGEEEEGWRPLAVSRCFGCVNEIAEKMRESYGAKKIQLRAVTVEEGTTYESLLSEYNFTESGCFAGEGLPGIRVVRPLEDSGHTHTKEDVRLIEKGKAAKRHYVRPPLVESVDTDRRLKEARYVPGKPYGTDITFRSVEDAESFVNEVGKLGYGLSDHLSGKTVSVTLIDGSDVVAVNRIAKDYRGRVAGWALEESLKEQTEVSDETLDDVFDNIIRKLIILGSIDALRDVDFDEDTGSIYLFMDASMGQEEVARIQETVNGMYQGTQIVATPTGQLPEETEPADWWVIFVPQESFQGQVGQPYPPVWGAPPVELPAMTAGGAVTAIAQGVSVAAAIDALMQGESIEVPKSPLKEGLSFDMRKIQQRGFVRVIHRSSGKFGPDTVADGQILLSVMGFEYFREADYDKVLTALSNELELGLEVVEESIETHGRKNSLDEWAPVRFGPMKGGATSGFRFDRPQDSVAFEREVESLLASDEMSGVYRKDARSLSVELSPAALDLKAEIDDLAQKHGGKVWEGSRSTHGRTSALESALLPREYYKSLRDMQHDLPQVTDWQHFDNMKNIIFTFAGKSYAYEYDAGKKMYRVRPGLPTRSEDLDEAGEFSLSPAMRAVEKALKNAGLSIEWYKREPTHARGEIKGAGVEEIDHAWALLRRLPGFTYDHRQRAMVSGSVYVGVNPVAGILDVSVEDIGESVEEAIEGLDFDAFERGVDLVKSEIDAPHVSAVVSTLGGKERPSLMINLSLDPKETWSHGIFQNSRYLQLHLSHTGGLELVAQDYRMKPKFRKLRVSSVPDAIQKINRWISRFGSPVESVTQEDLNAIYDGLDEQRQQWAVLSGSKVSPWDEETTYFLLAQTGDEEMIKRFYDANRKRAGRTTSITLMKVDDPGALKRIFPDKKTPFTGKLRDIIRQTGGGMSASAGMALASVDKDGANLEEGLAVQVIDTLNDVTVQDVRGDRKTFNKMLAKYGGRKMKDGEPRYFINLFDRGTGKTVVDNGGIGGKLRESVAEAAQMYRVDLPSHDPEMSKVGFRNAAQAKGMSVKMDPKGRNFFIVHVRDVDVFQKLLVRFKLGAIPMVGRWAEGVEGITQEELDSIYEGAFKISAKKPATMKAREINKELERLAKESSKVNQEFIDVGRGHERPSQYLKAKDPLALRAQELYTRKTALQIEVEMRAGPGNYEIPLTGKRGEFGPRESA